MIRRLKEHSFSCYSALSCGSVWRLIHSSRAVSCLLQLATWHRTSSGTPPQQCSRSRASRPHRLSVTHQPAMTANFSHATDVGDRCGWFRVQLAQFSHARRQCGNTEVTEITGGEVLPSELRIGDCFVLSTSDSEVT